MFKELIIPHLKPLETIALKHNKEVTIAALNGKCAIYFEDLAELPEEVQIDWRKATNTFMEAIRPFLVAVPFPLFVTIDPVKGILWCIKTPWVDFEAKVETEPQHTIN
jgi:hypothetical protein